MQDFRTKLFKKTFDMNILYVEGQNFKNMTCFRNIFSERKQNQITLLTVNYFPQISSHSKANER